MPLHAAVKLEPVCGDHSAQKGTLRAFQSHKLLREIPHCSLVDWFGALWAPYLSPYYARAAGASPRGGGRGWRAESHVYTLGGSRLADARSQHEEGTAAQSHHVQLAAASHAARAAYCLQGSASAASWAGGGAGDPPRPPALLSRTARSPSKVRSAVGTLVHRPLPPLGARGAAQSPMRPPGGFHGSSFRSLDMSWTCHGRVMDEGHGSPFPPPGPHRVALVELEGAPAVGVPRRVQEGSWKGS